MFCAVWARAISGISKPDSVAKKENGNVRSGIAMPRSAPNWESAMLRLPAYSAKHAGTRLVSAVRSKLETKRFPSTGKNTSITLPQPGTQVGNAEILLCSARFSALQKHSIHRQEIASLSVLPIVTSATARGISAPVAV